jgi:hypothetical protein
LDYPFFRTSINLLEKRDLVGTPGSGISCSGQRFCGQLPDAEKKGRANLGTKLPTFADFGVGYTQQYRLSR